MDRKQSTKLRIAALCLTLSALAAGGLAGCGKERIVYVEHAADGTTQLRYPQRKAIFTQVTDEYGPLVVSPGKFYAASKSQPWSGWWYPKRERYLFDRGPGLQAPLQKYDAYVAKKTGQNPGSAAYEEHDLFLYNPSGGSADGLCDALSGASLLEAEPMAPVTLNGITFEVQDLKALLVKTYENVAGLEVKGERNNNGNNDFQDMYPDQFHRFIQRELQQRGRPCYYDRDPSAIVWNTPVYKMDGEIKPDPSDANVMHVELTLVSASPFVDQSASGQNFVGRIEVLHEYTYDLYGETRPDGFHAVYGEWTGESVEYHPDFVTRLPESVDHFSIKRLSNNVKIDTALVDEIVSQALRRDKW